MERIEQQHNGEHSPRVDRGDLFVYQKSTEAQNPTLARVAQYIHAQSYLHEGFLFESAIDESGRVTDDIDKARGKDVEYYVGVNKEGVPVSTLRAVKASDSDGYEGLPGYQLCENVISEEAKKLLKHAQEGGRTIKEISSLGHVPDVRPTAGVEIIRHAVQESHELGEVWFCALVTSKFKALVHRLGPRAVRRAGGEVYFNDERINKDVSLTPAYVDMATFFDDMVESILEADTEKRRRELMASLRSFTKGVKPELLSDTVRMVLSEDDAYSVVSYAQKKGVRMQQDAWSQPLQLDLSDRFDRMYSKKLIDKGDVTTVVDPPWHEEFPTVDSREDDGSWFFYPWDKSLVHFPNQDDYRSMRQLRDRHLVTQEEQEALINTRGLYAGLSVGSHVLEHMVYAGVSDSHYLADFDSLSVSNLNRIHAGMHQVGEKKIDIAAKKISRLDPYAEQHLMREGITVESLDSLERVPDIIFDEVDDLAAKALLRIYAKEKRIPLIMATDVGYRTIIDVERHDIEDIRLFNGRISQDVIDRMLYADLSDEERRRITTRLVGLSNASLRLIQSLGDPALKGIPQLGVTASQGGALATIVARDILLGKRAPSGRHVHNARRAVGLSGQTSLSEGVKIIKQFTQST